ncbi:hypothetical protein V2J09_024204 [Rumex salicifolius]
MEEGGGGRRRYCVTGASGYIGSWLVKNLLQSGHFVHAAVRHPERCSYLLSKWNGGTRLKLFKADLQDDGSFDDPVNGCDGSYVQLNIIEPAIKGTLNLLRSCSNSDSVKRVVFTSSISTISAQEDNGRWRSVVDESCRTHIDHVLATKASGWVYVLTKLLTEEAAFKFAKENDIDLVSIITTTVGGPFLTSIVPSSIRVLLSPITEDIELFPILVSVSTRMGSMCLVHIEDICNAHIFLMEHPLAQGKYMCCAGNCHVSELLDLLIKAYPKPNMQRIKSAERGKAPSKISSKKLLDLGFVYKYHLHDIINQTAKSRVDCSYLPPI